MFKNNPYKFSVDRIDPNLPYSNTNIHLVCWFANNARNSMELIEFKTALTELQKALLKKHEESIDISILFQ
jgi:hypothetical protein